MDLRQFDNLNNYLDGFQEIEKCSIQQPKPEFGGDGL
jgi:hypothetical protein